MGRGTCAGCRSHPVERHLGGDRTGSRPRQAGRRDLSLGQPQRARSDDAPGSRLRGVQRRGWHGGVGSRGAPVQRARRLARPRRLRPRSTLPAMADVAAARSELQRALGRDRVLDDPLALRLYARDASMVEGGCALVAFPTSVDDIVSCINVSAAHGLPVVPRGSGTGLAGAATPIGDALVVVTAKMNRILEIRPDDGLAWVEPGLFNLDLADALRATGLTYAPDPAGQQTSSIGG